MGHMFSVTEGLKNSEIKNKIAYLISIDGGQTSDSSLAALFGLLGVSSMSLMNINESHENCFPVHEVPF